MTRVNELLKREIAEDIRRLQPPNFSMSDITITRVLTTPDLRQAMVYISVFNEDEQTETEVIRYFHKNRGAIQKMVSSRVQLKYTPKLEFKADHSLEEGDSILNLIADMEQNTPEMFGKKEDEEKNGL
jgi:ribosome-binding factor A